jgi:alkanesulfonate monooxygenase SsuD/methylene tetrahydromethanopterin reductase-like flavin-dependent oxidoreductase (luciferase family)
MRFGVRYSFRNPKPWRVHPSQLYNRILDQIEWLDGNGFDAVSFAEHHGRDDDFLPSLMTICAATAARTKHVRIGTDIFLLPLHHPVQVAEDGAIVDILSNGRFELVVGAGYIEDEFSAFGMKLNQRPGRMEEGVEIIKRCWTEQEFSFQGRYYQLDKVRVTPKPVQSPRPKIIMGTSSVAAARRAARIADGMKPADSSLWETYYSELESMGRSVHRRVHLPHPVYLHITEDPERDWPLIAPHGRYEIECYQKWGMGLSAYGELLNNDAALRKTYILATPDEAITLLKPLHDANPDDTFWFAPLLPGMNPELGQASLELAARKVIPFLK